MTIEIRSLDHYKMCNFYSFNVNNNNYLFFRAYTSIKIKINMKYEHNKYSVCTTLATCFLDQSGFFSLNICTLNINRKQYYYPINVYNKIEREVIKLNV